MPENRAVLLEDWHALAQIMGKKTMDCEPGIKMASPTL